MCIDGRDRCDVMWCTFTYSAERGRKESIQVTEREGVDVVNDLC